MKEVGRKIGRFARRAVLGGVLMHAPGLSPADAEPKGAGNRVSEVDRAAHVEAEVKNFSKAAMQTPVEEEREEEYVGPVDDLGPVIDEITSVLGDEYLVMIQASEDEKQHVDVIAEGGRMVASVFVEGHDLIIFPEKQDLGYVVTGIEKVPDLIDALSSAGDTESPDGQEPAAEDFRHSVAQAKQVERSEFSTQEPAEEGVEEDSGSDEESDTGDSGDVDSEGEE